MGVECITIVVSSAFEAIDRSAHKV